MTTDPAILAQLQAAWGRAAIVAQQPPMGCMVHIDERRWLDEPATGRPGYVRTTCRDCGAFIGYRQTDYQESNQLLDQLPTEM
jgi:hypothetical protein